MTTHHTFTSFSAWLKGAVLVLLLTASSLHATSSFEAFKRFKTDVLIETGAGSGKGIERALNAGYQTVISIELYKRIYSTVKNKFRDHNNVQLVHGDSAVMLPRVLAKLNQRATFWLDAHDNQKGNTVANVPLLKEIRAIAKHPIKNHNILIDDIRLLAPFGTTVCDIVAELKKVNPNYTFELLDGHVPGDILVAYVRD